MVKRLLLNTNGLKISKAGVAVDGATGSDVLFATGSDEYNGLFLAGSLEIADFVIVGNKHTATVSYGKTFAILPKVHAAIENPQSTVYANGHVTDTFLYVWSTSTFYWRTRVYFDRVEFEVENNGVQFGVPVWYKVFY